MTPPTDVERRAEEIRDLIRYVTPKYPEAHHAWRALDAILSERDSLLSRLQAAEAENERLMSVYQNRLDQSKARSPAQTSEAMKAKLRAFDRRQDRQQIEWCQQRIHDLQEALERMREDGIAGRDTAYRRRDAAEAENRRLRSVIRAYQDGGTA